MDKRRLGACLLGGVLAALICVSGGYLRGAITTLSPFVLAASIANRMLIAFVIAVSHWRLPHLLHGGVVGLLVSLVTSISFIGADGLTFVLYTAAGIFYGVMIEFIASVLFKAPAKCGAAKAE
jgi:hypothetical protein